MRRLQLTLALLMAATMTVASVSVQQDARAARPTPGPDEIERALTAVKADPNLRPERTIRLLRWNTTPARGSNAPAWLKVFLRWLAGLVGWLNESSRLLWWLAAPVLAGALVVYLIRLARARSGPAIPAEKFVAPTHVRDLDIRPETLPTDVGAAARAMWDRGDRRLALALLYRGLLSRLAHVHRVPIRDSTTEGDCLALSANLSSVRREYTSRLVTVWQRAVYGGESVPTDTVHGLCIEFGPTLDRAGQPDAARSGARS